MAAESRDGQGEGRVESPAHPLTSTAGLHGHPPPRAQGGSRARPQAPNQTGHVVAVLRWLAGQLAHEGHPLAHVPRQLADVVRQGAPDGGCKTCGGPVEPVRNGRPRLHCETCRPPRRKADAKPAPKSSMAA